ncbi:MAG: hypothetical protein IJD86_11505 [Clostridia bacterium]|nr:hypothetical protein [Clostridia bacterium]
MNFKRLLSIIMTLFMLVPFIAFSEEPEEIFEVHFLSVGDNDGILLRAGDECAFIDCGNRPQAPICIDYLKNAGVTSLKYYIASHAHTNHVGGAPQIIAEFPTKGLIYTHDMARYQIEIHTKTDEEAAAFAALELHPTDYLDTYTLGGATLTCVGPEFYSYIYRINDTSENKNSLLLHITYGDISFFLTGDSTSEKILQMSKMHPEVLKSDVIKSPHHGGGFYQSVYDLIDSQYIVFSTSDIGVPKENQMTMAAKSFDNILITADNRNGNIIFRTDGKTLSVETQFDYDYDLE